MLFETYDNGCRRIRVRNSQYGYNLGLDTVLDASPYHHRLLALLGILNNVPQYMRMVFGQFKSLRIKGRDPVDCGGGFIQGFLAFGWLAVAKSLFGLI